MIAVIGLGNPGKKYDKSRHNAGFYTLQCIAGFLNQKFIAKSNYEYFEVQSADKKVKFIRPLTFMNLSGDVFAQLRNDSIEKLIVVVDNIDLELGKIRFKDGGGNAGHNGLKSIIEKYPKKEDFLRMYIGAGREEGVEVADFVLSPLKGDKFTLFDKKCREAAGIILEYIKDGDFEKARAACNQD